MQLQEFLGRLNVYYFYQYLDHSLSMTSIFYIFFYRLRVNGWNFTLFQKITIKLHVSFERNILVKLYIRVF